MSRRFLTAMMVAALAVNGLTAADMKPVFTGLLRSDMGDRFVLTDSEDGVASGWLRAGQDYRGCTIVGFDAESGLLTVKLSERTRQLSLKPEAVKDGAADAEQAREAHATEVAAVVLVDREVDYSGEEKDSNGAPFFRLKGGRAERTSARIAIEKGKTFGLMAELAGLPAAAPVEIDYLMANPPMRYPDGRLVSSAFYSYKTRTSDSGTLSGQGYFFSFDHDYEMVPGRYRLEMRYKSKLLAVQEFDLYLPGADAKAQPPVDPKTPKPAPRP